MIYRPIPLISKRFPCPSGFEVSIVAALKNRQHLSYEGQPRDVGCWIISPIVDLNLVALIDSVANSIWACG